MKPRTIVIGAVVAAGAAYLVWRYVLGGNHFLAQHRVDTWAAGTAARQDAERKAVA